MCEFTKSEPPCVEPEPATRDAPEVPPAKPDAPLVEALLDEPKERKPPGFPELRRLELARPPEVRPAAELPLPKECHCPSLTALRALEERLAPEPEPFEPKLRLELPLGPNPPLRALRPRDPPKPPEERLLP